MAAADATKFDVFGDYCNVVDGKLKSTTNVRNGINPATGNKLPNVPVVSIEDVNAAVSAGQKAFKTWSRVSFKERQKRVLDFAKALEGHASDFAKLLTQEQGKPVRASLSQLG
jgi:acyl-CoA reductase-like NAD-dependent aldehyde dehydrogenase